MSPASHCLPNAWLERSRTVHDARTRFSTNASCTNLTTQSVPQRADIAAELHVATRTVCLALGDHGIRLRPRGRPALEDATADGAAETCTRRAVRCRASL